MNRRMLLPILDQLGLLLVLAGLIAYFGATSSHFLSADNFRTIANQIPATVLAAVGMTYVLVIGGIDLSVGSVLGLSGAVMGYLMTRQPDPAPLWLAAAAALGAGLVCGILNGVIHVAWNIPSFVVTLGMLEIARGAAHWIANSQTAYIGTPAGALSDAAWYGLSLPFWIAMAAVALGQLVLSRTIFGRYLVAIGTNEEAVRLSGIETRPIRAAVFILAATLAAAGAVMEVSRAQASNPNAGTGLELQVIAAVVIGGTSLMGGRGSVVNSLLGVVIVAVLSSGLASRGVRDETKRLITGCVIILAVVVDYYRIRWTRR